jgi:hypothetical protein
MRRHLPRNAKNTGGILMTDQDRTAALRSLRTEWGYSAFDRAIRTLNRERLDSKGQGREKREKFTWGELKRMAQKQRWICPRCTLEMAPIKGQLEVDHYDPNNPDFNDANNLRVLHKKCNREKGANTPMQEAKATGKTVIDQLTPPMRQQIREGLNEFDAQADAARMQDQTLRAWAETHKVS